MAAGVARAGCGLRTAAAPRPTFSIGLHPAIVLEPRTERFHDVRKPPGQHSVLGGVPAWRHHHWCPVAGAGLGAGEACVACDPGRTAAAGGASLAQCLAPSIPEVGGGLSWRAQPARRGRHPGHRCPSPAPPPGTAANMCPSSPRLRVFGEGWKVCSSASRHAKSSCRSRRSGPLAGAAKRLHTSEPQRGTRSSSRERERLLSTAPFHFDWMRRWG